MADFTGHLQGISVKPDKDGDLEARVIIGFPVAEDEMTVQELVEMLRRAVRIQIDPLQPSMFATVQRVDADTGEILAGAR